MRPDKFKNKIKASGFSTDVPLDDRLDALQHKMDDLEARVAALAGPHIEVSTAAYGPTGELVEGPHAEIVAAEGPPPGQSVAEWISTLHDLPGFVIDPGRARSTPCIRAELPGGEKPIIFSPGISGPLNEEQQALYCQSGYEDYRPSEERWKRMVALHESANVCATESRGLPSEEERMIGYHACMGRELRQRGVTP